MHDGMTTEAITQSRNHLVGEVLLAHLRRIALAEEVPAPVIAQALFVLKPI